MKIHIPEIQIVDDQVRISSLIETNKGQSTLWFSVDKEYAEYVTTERLDAFLVAMLLPAMRLGEDIYLDGPVSEKLYYNLTNYYMAIMLKTKSRHRRIKIIPSGLDNGKIFKTGRGVVTGFSGGIDSMSLFVDHSSKDTPEGYRLTHLIFNNVGSHGKTDPQNLFLRRFNKVLPFAQEQNLPMAKIDSNLSEFYVDPFIQNHQVRNVAAVLTLQKLFRRYIYASADVYENNVVRMDNYSNGEVESLSFHLLSTDSMECVLSGAQYSRVEKTRRIAQFPASQKYLDVCTHETSAFNCSLCEKCMRTLLTLEVLGEIDHYGSIFNLKAYRLNRDRYISEILAAPGTYGKEIIRLAKEENFSIPAGSLILSRILSSVYLAKKWRRAILNRMRAQTPLLRPKPL